MKTDVFFKALEHVNEANENVALCCSLQYMSPADDSKVTSANGVIFARYSILKFKYFLYQLFCVSAVRSKRTDFGPHDWHSMPVSGAQTWLVVPGLEPGTEYQFSVLAQNKLGTGPFSEVVTVNTTGEQIFFFHSSSQPSKNKQSDLGQVLELIRDMTRQVLSPKFNRCSLENDAKKGLCEIRVMISRSTYI